MKRRTTIHRLTGFCVTLLTALLLQASTASAGGPLVIDDFTDAVSVLQLTSDPNGAPVSATDSPVDVLGGSRTTTLLTTSQGIPGFDTTTITYFEGGGFSFLDTSSQVGWGGVLQLTYDLSSLPSVLDGATGVIIEFLGYDSPAGGPMPVMAVLDGVGGPVSLATGGPQVLEVLFDAPAAGSYDELMLSFVVPLGGDFRLDEITLPEPGTAALILLGLGGIAIAGRPRS